MKEWTKAQKQRQRTIIYLYVLLALLVLLVTASYTWFSISQTPRVSSMEMNIESTVGIELAQNYDDEDEAWGRVLDFQNIVGVDTVLQPASWSANHNCLVTAAYGTDGRVIENKYQILSDDRHANRNGRDAYYVKGSFFA